MVRWRWFEMLCFEGDNPFNATGFEHQGAVFGGQDQVAMVMLVNGETEQCRQIIKGLLNFARPQSQERGSVALSEVVHETVYLMEKNLKVAGVEVNLEADGATESQHADPAESGTARDAEDVGIGERVAKQRLEERSRHGEGGTDQRGEHHPRQADAFQTFLAGGPGSAPADVFLDRLIDQGLEAAVGQIQRAIAVDVVVNRWRRWRGWRSGGGW